MKTLEFATVQIARAFERFVVNVEATSWSVVKTPSGPALLVRGKSTPRTHYVDKYGNVSIRNQSKFQTIGNIVNGWRQSRDAEKSSQPHSRNPLLKVTQFISTRNQGLCQLHNEYVLVSGFRRYSAMRSILKESSRLNVLADGQVVTIKFGQIIPPDKAESQFTHRRNKAHRDPTCESLFEAVRLAKENDRRLNTVASFRAYERASEKFFKLCSR